jgi:hypothetical protein
MPRKLKKRIKPVIEFNNGLGGRLLIKSPVLLSIFQSPKIIQAYKEDPERKYSVREIFELINKNMPLKEPTVRRALSDNKEFFETTKEIDVVEKKNSKTIMVINFTKFKPFAENVFNAVEELFKEDEDE